MEYEASIGNSQKFKRYLALWQQHDSANKKQALTNPEADPMLLEILCSDKDEEIILQAAQHANHNEHSLERLAQHSHTLVRQSVAKHRNSSGHILLSLLNDEDATVTFLAVERIINSDNASAKLRLLQSHNHLLNQGCLEILQQDGDGQVRLHAYEVLQQHYQNTLEIFYNLQDTEPHASINSTNDSSTTVPISQTSSGVGLSEVEHNGITSSKDDQFNNSEDDFNAKIDTTEVPNDLAFEDETLYAASRYNEILNDVTCENETSLEPSSTVIDIPLTQEEAIIDTKDESVSGIVAYFETDIATDALLADENINDVDSDFELFALQDNLTLTDYSESQKITEQLLYGKAIDEERLYKRAQELLQAIGLRATDKIYDQLADVLDYRDKDSIVKAFLSVQCQGYDLTAESILLADKIKIVFKSYDKYNHPYYNWAAQRYMGYVINWEKALQLSAAFRGMPNLENLETFFAQYYELYAEYTFHNSSNKGSNNKDTFTDYLLDLADMYESLDTFGTYFLW